MMDFVFSLKRPFQIIQQVETIYQLQNIICAPYMFTTLILHSDYCSHCFGEIYAYLFDFLAPMGGLKYQDE